MKVGRFSYPLPTPSAARGIFDSIFSKPSRAPTRAQFRWQITRTEVLKEPRFIALRRNEVKEKVSTRKVRSWLGWEGHIQTLEPQFREHASRGKCFQQPYLGCRSAVVPAATHPKISGLASVGGQRRRRAAKDCGKDGELPSVSKA